MLLSALHLCDILGHVADGLQLHDLIMDMEDRFGITVEDDQIMNLKTVGDVAEYIAKVKG